MKTPALFLAITAAVFIGSLAARATYDYWLLRVTAITVADTLAEKTATRRALTETNAVADRQRRADSPTGRDLIRRCGEFTTAAATLRTAYANEQKQIACARSSDYIEAGRY
jgi:hypothetical protein